MNKKSLFLIFISIFCSLLYAETEIKISKVKRNNFCGISFKSMAMEKASAFFIASSSKVFEAFQEKDKVIWKESSDSFTKKVYFSDYTKKDITFRKNYYGIETIEAELYELSSEKEVQYSLNVLEDSSIFLPENTDGKLILLFKESEKNYLIDIKISNLIESLIEKSKGKFLTYKDLIEFLSKTYDEKNHKDEYNLKKYLDFAINSFFEDENNFFTLYKNNTSIYIKYYLRQLYESGLRYDYEFLSSKINEELYEASKILSRELEKAFGFDSYIELLKYSHDKEEIFDIESSDIYSLMDKFNPYKNSKAVMSFYDVIVPELKDIKKGDFLKIRYGKNKEGLFFISYTKENTSSYNEFLEKTYLSGFTKDSVFLRKIKLKDILKEGDDFYCVRLTPQKKFSKNLAWNIFSKPEVTSVDALSMYESDQTDKELFWECIPNTGEYLVASNIKFEIMKSSGIKFSEEDYSKYYVSFFSAIDPDGKLFDKDGNYIREEDEIKLLNGRQEWEVKDELVFSVNKSPSFDFAFFDENERPFFSGKLIKKAGGYDYYPVFDEVYTSIPLLYFSEDGVLKYENGQTAKIAVRPSSFANSYPGDEVQLAFNLYKKNTESFIACEKINTVMKVYDKKMVWRANLYLDETIDESSEENNSNEENSNNSTEENTNNEQAADWNNIHIWNAPCDEKSSLTSWWWNSEWGYNNWNRNLFSINFEGAVNELSQGDGSQVITFPEYTPFRNKGKSKSVKNNISYDYDDDKEILAWDSPFDFVYKLKMQNLSLTEHFTNFLKDIPERSIKLYSVKGEFPANDTAIIPDVDSTAVLLSRWKFATAPEDRWELYWKSSKEKNKAFIPGLGFFHHATSDSYFNGNFSDVKKYNFPDNLSAGTDCMGMVVRSMSYKDCPYKWKDYNTMPFDTAESGELSIIKRGLSYPQYSGESVSAFEIINWAFMTFDKSDSQRLTEIEKEEVQGTYKKYIYKDENSCLKSSDYKLKYSEMKDFQKALFERSKKYFLKCVPGDVIAYGPDTSKEKNFLYNYRIRSHIGLIAEIDYKALKEAESFVEIGRSVKILESVYGALLFGTIKRSMTEGGSGEKRKAVENDKITGSWFFKEADVQRCWGIQRLLKK